jgi:WD40 repeat protein
LNNLLWQKRVEIENQRGKKETEWIFAEVQRRVEEHRRASAEKKLAADPEASGNVSPPKSRLRILAPKKHLDINGYAIDSRITSAAFSKDGDTVVTSSASGYARTWGGRDGLPKLQLEDPRRWDNHGRFNQASFSPDGRLIVIGTQRKIVRVWDAKNGKFLYDLKPGWEQSLVGYKGHSDWIQTATFSPDSQRIVTAGGDGFAKIWNARNGKLFFELSHGEGNGVHSSVFSPDGQSIVTTTLAGEVQFWDAFHGRLLFQLPKHSQAVYYANFSKDGRWIITASADGMARVWDTSTGDLLFTLQGHTRGVTAADFSPDHQWIITGSSDGTSRIWETTSGRLRATIPSANGLYQQVSFSPDSQYVLTLFNDYTVRVWSLYGELELQDP